MYEFINEFLPPIPNIFENIPEGVDLTNVASKHVDLEILHFMFQNFAIIFVMCMMIYCIISLSSMYKL